MPGVAFNDAGSGVIAGKREHSGLFAQQDGNRGVELFNSLFLGCKVAVLTIHVGVFVMNEKEIVIIVFGEVALELFGDGLRAFQLGHADKLRQAFVHWVNGNAPCSQPIAIMKGGNGRLMSDAAQEETVGRMLFRNNREGSFVKVGDEFGGLFCFG